jgi:hypothetical protein
MWRLVSDDPRVHQQSDSFVDLRSNVCDNRFGDAVSKSGSWATDRHHPSMSAGVADDLDVIAVRVVRPR